MTENDFNSLDKTVALLQKDMKNIADKVDDGFSANSKEHKDLVALFEKAMEKKAGVWVERVMIGVGSVIGVALLGALISLVINK